MEICTIIPTNTHVNDLWGGGHYSMYLQQKGQHYENIAAVMDVPIPDTMSEHVVTSVVNIIHTTTCATSAVN